MQLVLAMVLRLLECGMGLILTVKVPFAYYKYILPNLFRGGSIFTIYGNGRGQVQNSPSDLNKFLPSEFHQKKILYGQAFLQRERPENIQL